MSATSGTTEASAATGDWERRVAACRDRLARTTHVSRWFDVEQEAMTLFATATADPDPYHIDPAWAAAHTPFGGTIAQGMWTASMLVRVLHESGMGEAIVRELDVPIGLNYGFDRLRFVAPVPVGSRIRGHLVLRDLVAKDARTVIGRLDAVVECDRVARPVAVGEWLVAFRRDDRDDRDDPVEPASP